MSPKFQVYFLTSNPRKSSKLLASMENLFSDGHLFNFQITHFESRNWNSSSKEREADRLLKILRKSQTSSSSDFVVILKDSCRTVTSKSVICSIFKRLKKLSFDLCYLSKWLDRCDLYQPVSKSSELYQIVKTCSPHGIQALVISPEGRNKILNGKIELSGNLDSELNRQIENRKLKALALVPNLFNFDTSKATSVTDLAKLSECRRPENNGQNEQPLSLNFFFFIILGLIIFLLILNYCFSFFCSPYKSSTPSSPCSPSTSCSPTSTTCLSGPLKN